MLRLKFFGVAILLFCVQVLYADNFDVRQFKRVCSKKGNIIPNTKIADVKFKTF